MERIIGAFTFRKEVYAEVEKDVEFTPTAWLIVVVVSALNQLGQLPGAGGIGRWLVASILRVVFAVASFALGASVLSWAGKQFFEAEVDFGEMVRVLGLAYVWNIIGILGIVGFVPPLLCIVAPILFVALIAGLVAWLFAAKEALDLDWGPTVIVVLIAWAIGIVAALVANLIINRLGFGPAEVTSVFGR
jgi:hypothetical protein